MGSKKKREKRRRKAQKRRDPRAWRRVLDPEAPTAMPLRKMYASRDGRDLLAEIESHIAEALPRFIDPETGYELARIVDAAEAWEVLDEVHNLVTERVQAIVGDRGSAEWLWFLRRLRGQFNVNEWATTDPYVQALAEALTAGISRPSEPADMPTFTFPFDGQVLHDLYWLREMALRMYELQSTMKRCAKGQDVEFVPDDMPWCAPNAALDRAMRMYDERTERAQTNLLSAVGVATPIGRDMTEVVGDEPRIGGLVPIWHFVPTRRAKFLHTADPPPAILEWIDLDLIPPLRQQASLTKEHIALIALLWACFNIGVREADRAARRLSAAFQWGYMITPHDNYLMRALDEMAKWLVLGHGAAIDADVLPADGAEIARTLGELEPSILPPLCGNPIHRAGHVSMIDLVGASARLYPTLLRPSDGADVNYWSNQFEQDVQAIIDASSAKPDSVARAAVGKTIRRMDGSAITDIDAIAQRPRHLLLVSCKSVAFTLPAIGGAHGAIREISAKVQQAAEAWAGVIEEIRSDPSVVGFPLPPDTQIDGCVILPAVPFSADPDCQREVLRGLPFVASSTELANALRA